MKLKAIFTLLMVLSIGTAFASFPVERKLITNVGTEVSSKTEEKSEFTAIMTSEKSQGVTLILALVLGLLAAHRWYLGKPTLINIFFIFTLGGFFVWLIIDIVRIITRDLGPDDGRYKKDFF